MSESADSTSDKTTSLAQAAMDSGKAALATASSGARAGAKLRGEQLRILLALMVLLVCAKLLYDLTVTPTDIYSIGLSE